MEGMWLVFFWSGPIGLGIGLTLIGAFVLLLAKANEINKRADIKLVNIQHEYGLFGGEQGEFLIPFLELLKKVEA